MSKKEKSGNWFARHKVLSVILAVIVIAVIASALGGGSKKKDSSTVVQNNTPSSSSQQSQQAPASSVAKIGEPARDGKFEFTVSKIQCGVTVVGDQYLTKQPQGQFCLLSLTVKNIGTSQQYFSQGDQKLLDAASVQYSYDSVATLYNSNNQDAFGAQINPGNSVVGVLVFDIPKDKTPVTAELHDSSLSNGVKVSLQ